MSSYLDAYSQSLDDPIGFWRQQAETIDWYKKPEVILSKDENGSDRWFADGELNTAWLALDRHVSAGRGDQIALIYDSPVTRTVQQYSYAELTELVAVAAGALQRSGVVKGDRVVIYMPMIPETVIAMLACARIGAIHSVVFGGFAARELAMRIDDAAPKLVLSATCGIEFETVISYLPLLDEAISIASHSPDEIVVLQREMAHEDLAVRRYRDWRDWLAESTPADCVPVNALDPLYILYTSGTTGAPKGVLRDNGGHAVALNYSMEAVYGCDTGDVFWAASDVGWVVGHSYIVYGPLLKGCTTILYEGKPVRTPDAGAFWRVISQHKVKCFFVAPTAFRAIRKEDPDCESLAHYDISSLEYLFLAGERTDPPTWFWLQEHTQLPVIDHWWQTETGWAICANMVGYGLHEMRAGSITFPVPGYDVRIFDDSGEQLTPGKEGNVVIKAPLPPGALPTVWRDHERFIQSYWSAFEGCYATGDGGFIDVDGYVYIMGRNDDVMNIAGHRLSTGQLEESLATHPAVAECAVVGMKDEDKGQVPLGFVLVKDGINISEAALLTELVQIVRRDVGPFANFKRALIVARLPKTRSGKILRQVLRKMADGEPYEVPPTIDDPSILEEIKEQLSSTNIGLPAR